MSYLNKAIITYFLNFGIISKTNDIQNYLNIILKYSTFF